MGRRSESGVDLAGDHASADPAVLNGTGLQDEHTPLKAVFLAGGVVGSVFLQRRFRDGAHRDQSGQTSDAVSSRYVLASVPALPMSERDRT